MFCMVVHFVCRGNAFRSLIAEAYLKSLGIKDLEVHSSGTVAEKYKPTNKEAFNNTLEILRKHGIERFAKSNYGDQLEQSKTANSDITICVNQIVYDESKILVNLPANTLVWDITDLGEKGRIPKTKNEAEVFREDIYQEITKNVDELVKEQIMPAQH